MQLGAEEMHGRISYAAYVVGVGVWGMEQMRAARMKFTPLRRYARAARSARMPRFLATIGLGALLLSIVLSACAPSPSDVAQQNKARLDQELHNASTNMSVPDLLLQPIERQEQTVAAGTKKGSDASYQSAAASYTQLYNQVVAIEKWTPAQAHTQANADLKQLVTSVQDVQNQGFAEAGGYAQRLQQAQQQFSSAKTTKDYFKLDTFVQGQLAAIKQIDPVYQQMRTLNKQIDVQNQSLGLNGTASGPQPLQCALGDNDSYFTADADPSITVGGQQQQSAPKYQYQQWPAQDLSMFRTASSVQDYNALASLIHAQSTQLAADSTEMLPTITQHLLQTFQADVKTYRQNGGTDTKYQQQADQDAQTLATTQTVDGYNALVKTLQQQTQSLELPLLKSQTQHDLNTLKQLIAQGQAKITIDPANGQGYPDAYEYADKSGGIGDAEARFANAQTISDYQAVDAEVQMFITNIQAMLQNMNDNTPSDQPHATDMSLIQHYGVTPYNVIVVSLREQEARMYQNGKLVKAFKVTTGNPDLPTPPGSHCVFEKLSHTEFKSPEPKGSPYYYNPTPINYALLYSDYGFFLHDAWWRTWFGKYSNLPHYDPLSFNNGSHGCINFSLTDMTWLYKWAQVGTPVLVY